MTSDNTDDLLAPRPTLEDSGPLRQVVLLRTTGVLRRRRRLKQLVLVGACAACFAAGMVTMRWWTPTAPQVVQVRPDEKPETARPEAVSALAQENRALDAPDARTRSEGYNKAAELYRQQGDFADWVRCKDNALDDAPREDLIVSAEDDFLTIALKRERQKKENRDEVKPN